MCRSPRHPLGWETVLHVVWQCSSCPHRNLHLLMIFYRYLRPVAHRPHLYMQNRIVSLHFLVGFAQQKIGGFAQDIHGNLGVLGFRTTAMLRNSSIYDSKATLQNNLKGEKRFFKIVCAGGKMMGRCMTRMTSSSFKLITVILF